MNNIRQLLEWLMEILGITFKTGFTRDNSALLPVMTADSAVSGEKCAQLPVENLSLHPAI
ncbi:MAG: hypothetical protein FWD71_04455 [Oscillospiraceae bacterium]|nr:hypothetical protein [Oscillospiraceae bacterium]